MRSLFHFPLPCTTTLAVTVSYSNRPTAPEMSRRPHPAPMRRQRRSPVLLSAARPLPGPALTGPRPTVARSQGARHAAPPSLPRAAAVLHVLRFAVRIAPTVRRHPRHPPHLSPRVAAAPGPWLARIAPHASPFSRMREKGPLPGSIRPKCMLFEIKMATSSPHASIPGRNRAIRDTWRANLTAKGPFPRRGARNHAWREDVASAARPFRGSGMRHAAWPNGLCALLSRFAVRDPPRGPRTDASRYLRAAPIPPAARTHRVQETSGTTQTTQCGHKNRIPKWDPIEEFFGFAQRLPDTLQPLHQANELALSYLDHSTRQRLGGYVIGLSGNSFTVDLYAALVDHATSIAR